MGRDSFSSDYQDGPFSRCRLLAVFLGPQKLPTVVCPSEADILVQIERDRPAFHTLSESNFSSFTTEEGLCNRS